MTASYIDKTIPNVAWYYAQPYDKAKNIKDYVAFCQCLSPVISNQSD
jgi:uncharacterized protein (DUF427 family)